MNNITISINKVNPYCDSVMGGNRPISWREWGKGRARFGDQTDPLKSQSCFPVSDQSCFPVNDQSYLPLNNSIDKK